MPGFVDPHTHLIWAGDRADEFEKKMAGTPYLEILAAGGGILSTVKATRTASIETLMAQTRPRMLRMFRNGTTTAEAKTGYGLQTSTELRLLKALLALDDETRSTSSSPSSARTPSAGISRTIRKATPTRLLQHHAAHAEGMVGDACPAPASALCGCLL
jgi:imidazolonepropionase